MNRTTTNLAPLATHMIPFIYHDLATCFHVRGLAAIQIARLLERVLLLSEMCTWKAEECSYVGERARMQLAQMLGLDWKDASVDWPHWLDKLTECVAEELPAYGVQVINAN